MKALTYSILVLSFVMLTAQKQVNHEGTWVLKSYVDHTEKSKPVRTYDDNILFQKHIAGCHFAWIKYDLKEKKLLGMGGGTFTIDAKGRYIETIAFFYPFGSSEYGQSIKFNNLVKGSKWYHNGFVKKLELNNQGKMTTIDSIKIEEIWTRVKAKPQNMELVGTWILQKTKNEETEYYEELPNLIGYFKIVTPTHFIWIKYDAEGDQIYGAEVGTYSLVDGIYTEKIQANYPATVTRSTSFDYTREGNIWKLKGEVKKEAGITSIDEFWIPHTCRPTTLGLDHD